MDESKHERIEEQNLKHHFPQVKICGLTRVEQARACVDAGADAIGFVFYAKSPRNVSIAGAQRISGELPDGVARVGVFVDESFGFIMRRVEMCRLTAVQLHGMETPGLVLELKSTGVRVIKALFVNREPRLRDGSRFAVDAYLAECGRGPLPGGNARSWDFAAARGLRRSHPLILAGGLSRGNVSAAIQSTRPDAVDVSSGVEVRPGIKDSGLVKQFVKAVFDTKTDKPLRRIF